MYFIIDRIINHQFNLTIRYLSRNVNEKDLLVNFTNVDFIEFLIIYISAWICIHQKFWEIKLSSLKFFYKPYYCCYSILWIDLLCFFVSTGSKNVYCNSSYLRSLLATSTSLFLIPISQRTGAGYSSYSTYLPCLLLVSYG